MKKFINPKLLLSYNSIFWAFCLVLFLVLIFKNPFSGENIISDLEPSPDSIHYLNPVKNFIEGRGLKVILNNQEYPSTVPPLYSITLVPIYKIFNDFRSFYFLNLILSFTSIYFFYKIINQLIKNSLIKKLLFLGLITNYIFYWYPSVPMAENLLITLYIISIYYFIKPLSLKNSLILSFLSVSFYATKYIALPLSVALIICYLAKIIFAKSERREKIKLIITYIFTLVIFFISFSFLENYTKGGSSLLTIKENLLNLFNIYLGSWINAITHNQQIIKPTGSLFSSEFIQNNWVRYFAGLIGGPVYVAYKDVVIIPIMIGFLSIVGIFSNLIFSKYRYLCLYIFISVMGTLMLILPLKIVDARYLFALIPALFLTSGILLDNLSKFLEDKNRQIYFYLLLGVIFLMMLYGVVKPIKEQITINIKNDEPPQNYNSTLVLNNYFQNIHTPSKPVVIYILSPFIVDFYTNDKYELLPLSRGQYFIEDLSVWGLPKNIKLNEVYDKYLSEGREVYISNYKISSNYFYQIDFSGIESTYNLTKVYSGCDEECNIYKLSKK